MEPDGFEWDDEKAAENFRKHDLTFETASLVFDDPFGVDEEDRREDYGEDRYLRIGMVEGRLIFVAYTMRLEKIRIISARPAEPYERRRYHDNFE